MPQTPICTSTRNIHKKTNNDNISYEINTITGDEDNNSPSITTMYTNITAPYHITLSSDPIDNMFDIPIATNDTHISLGLVLEYDKSMNRIKLTNCIHVTPASKIPKWRSILRNGFITSYDNKSIKSIADIENW